MVAIKNPNNSDKSTTWISLSTSNVLLLIVAAMVLVVAGTNIFDVHSSHTGFGITAAYAQTSNTITTATSSSISSVNTLSFSIPVNIIQQKQMSDCPEDIHLSGNLLIETVTTVDSNGGSIVKVVQINPQDIKGVGLTTGTQYHSTTGIVAGGEEIANKVLAFSAREGGGGDTTQTFVTNFNFIGSNTTRNSPSVTNGDIDYIIVHEDLRIAVNSDGTITANIDNENSGCL